MASISSGRETIAEKMAAERAAREAEEARRREVMAKIKTLEDEISKCQGLISSFNGAKGQIGTFISQINGYKATNLEVNMNSFSGITAGAVSGGVADAQSAMGEKSNALSSVESAIGTQIGLLNSYIMELKSRVTVLKASL